MRILIVLFCLFLAVGCGASAPALKSKPVSVTGKLSQAGQPLGNVAVSFHPLDNGYQTSVPVNADGTFQGEMISGTYAYSIAQSAAATSAQVLSKIAPEYLEPNLERTVKIESGQEVQIALD